MRKASIIGGMVASSAAALMSLQSRAPRVHGFENIGRMIRESKTGWRPGTGSIAEANRHGGAHEHKREIERRQAQGARDVARQRLRGDTTVFHGRALPLSARVSRRGRLIG